MNEKNSITQTLDILKWVFLAWIAVIFITPAEFAGGAYMFSTVIFASASLVLFFGTGKKDALTYDKTSAVISAVMTALLLLQLSITQLFAGFNPDNGAVKFLLQPLFIISLAAASYITVYTMLNYALSEKTLSEKDGTLRKIPYIKLYYIVLPIAVMTAAYVIASYPSYSYSDISWVWGQVTDNVWNEWHTIGFVLFCKIFSLNGKSQYLILVFQGIFWIYICNYAVYVLHSVLNSKKACAVYGIMAAAVFTPMLYCGMLVKDPIYCMCLFLFVTGMFHAVHAKRLNAMNIAVLIVSGFGTSVFRHAGWVSVLLSLAVMFIYYYGAKKDIVKITAVFLAVMCASVTVNNILPKKILHAEENPAYVKYSVPMYLIGAVSSKVDYISDEDIAVMEKIMPREKWREAYESNIYWADPLSRTWGTIGGDVYKLNDGKTGSEIISLNLKWLFKYPCQYISSAFDISSIVWEIGRPADGYEWAPLRGGAGDFDGGDAGLKRTVSTTVTRSLSDLSFQNPLLHPIYWRGGLWLFMIIFAAVVLCRKKQYKYLIAISVPVITVLLLFLSIPSQDPRYILFLVECGVFITVFAAFAPHKKDEAVKTE